MALRDRYRVMLDSFEFLQGHHCAVNGSHLLRRSKELLWLDDFDQRRRESSLGKG